MLGKIVLAAAAGLFLISAAVHAEPKGFRSYQLPQHGSLQLSVPQSWNDQMRQSPQGFPPTILFTPDAGYRFNVQVTPLWPSKPGAKMPDADRIKTTVNTAANEAKAHAAETTVPIQEIKGQSGSGAYFALTDRDPKPGEFKYLSQGMLCVGDLVLAFTILSNDGAESAVAEALNMLKSARQTDMR